MSDSCVEQQLCAACRWPLLDGAELCPSCGRGTADEPAPPSARLRPIASHAYRGHAPFVEGSCTSEDAAASIEDVAGTLRAHVLQFVQHAGNATRDEIEVALAMPGNTVRPRVCELLESGHLVETEERRKTRSGRSAVVVRAARAG